MMLSRKDIKEISETAIQTPEGKALSEKMEEKRQRAIEYLGKKWLMHPDNHVQKKESK